MANFSPVNQVETSARLLKQILLKSIVNYMERDSARGAIQPGLKILARFAQTRLGFSARAKGPENGISARAEKQETIWLPLGSRSDFSGIKAIK